MQLSLNHIDRDMFPGEEVREPIGDAGKEAGLRVRRCTAAIPGLAVRHLTMPEAGTVEQELQFAEHGGWSNTARFGRARRSRQAVGGLARGGEDYGWLTILAALSGN